MGELIKYTDKGFLREHPFLDPFNNPAPVDENFNAFIFPGDEMVFWHKLTFPTDADTAVIGNISLVSAKLCIIAKKPQVFSEQFNLVFKSTRTFELDTFIVTFNNGNATMQLWGADGYAPNIHLTQDRNWKLPSGDFRRQIEFFTKHTNSTSVWDYWFYFPVLIRWEYWVALIAASDDFFNLSEPQDGKNHWWYHYLTSTWKIFSRLDINCLVQSEETIIRSELEITPGHGDLNDYSSNSDWTNKSIKTSDIGGTPTNAPAFVYDTKDTLIHAALKKVGSFLSMEPANISAVIWIEPLEGPGITARTRGSSLYQITPESVFKGLTTSPTDDDGLGVQTQTGQYIVFDPTGKGAFVLFDSVDVTEVTLFAVIDYTKLESIYPNVTKFTIYARLYNSTLNSGGGPYANQTRMGEEIKQDAVLISPPVDNALCEKREPLCPFALDVLADLTDSDDLKNDKSDFYQQGDPSVSDIMFVLAKITNCDIPGSDVYPIEGDYNDDYSDDFYIGDQPIVSPALTIEQLIADFLGEPFTGTVTLNDCVGNNILLLTSIIDNSYGRFFEFGKSNDFLNNDFEDDYGKKYTGLLLEWRKVLQQYGKGKYQIFVVKIDVFGNATVTCDPRIFCLRPYNCNFADKSVRIETVNEGLRGTLFDYYTQIDYAAGWYGQLRLKGVFKYASSGYNREYNQYGDSKFNIQKPIINEQVPKFILSLRPIPGWMDFVLSTDVLQADEVRITDYNVNNRQTFIKIPVMNDGDFTPRDNKLASPLSDVEISLLYAQNNLRKRNSQ